MRLFSRSTLSLKVFLGNYLRTGFDPSLPGPGPGPGKYFTSHPLPPLATHSRTASGNTTCRCHADLHLPLARKMGHINACVGCLQTLLVCASIVMMFIGAILIDEFKFSILQHDLGKQFNCEQKCFVLQLQPNRLQRGCLVYNYSLAIRKAKGAAWCTSRHSLNIVNVTIESYVTMAWSHIESTWCEGYTNSTINVEIPCWIRASDVEFFEESRIANLTIPDVQMGGDDNRTTLVRLSEIDPVRYDLETVAIVLIVGSGVSLITIIVYHTVYIFQACRAPSPPRAIARSTEPIDESNHEEEDLPRPESDFLNADREWLSSIQRSPFTTMVVAKLTSIPQAEPISNAAITSDATESVTVEVEDNLSCMICFSEITRQPQQDQTIPVALFGACGHLCCEQCGKSLLENTVRRVKSSSIRCPACREACHVSDIRVVPVHGAWRSNAP